MNQYFEQGSCLFSEGQKGIPLRLTEGVVMLCADAQYRPVPLYLARAGDLIGIETLFQPGYECTAVALTDVVLSDLATSAKRSELLRESFKSQQTRMVEMIQMRTGRLAKRLSLFIQALIEAQPGLQGPIARKELPSLRDMSLILDSAPESICRELANQPLILAEPTQPSSTPSRPSVVFSQPAWA